MTSRQLEAIAACTRTLAGAADADAELLASGAVTVGALRAAADRLALRRRYHDTAVYADLRPRDAAAGRLFDALEQARLDVLGVTWLPGMAGNLLAHPGPADDGLRWLAFEVFAGRSAPAEVAEAVARARARISATAVDALSRLMDRLGAQQAFAAAAAEWCLQVEPEALSVDAGVTPMRAPLRAPARTGVDIRRGRYAIGGTAQRQGQPEAEGSEHGGATARPDDDPVAALIGYRAYTRAFDRVVQAAALVSREELSALRVRLDADFSPIRSTVARVAKRLMRVLMARQAREWRFDLDEGLLDPSRLSGVVASRGTVRPFKQEFDSPFPSTAVTVLIDHSGSMQGRPMRIAALTVEIVVRVLERCGVRCEVLGFTTREWDGGEPARQWAANGYPEAPGRLNALEHIVIKAGDVPWRRARMGLGLSLRDDMLKENIDGEALAWAHARLVARSERRRILVVISDGTPMDEATFAANGMDYLDGHLAAVVEHIERRSPVRLAAVGIGHDVSRFYRNATRISRVDDLGPALTARLAALLAD